MRRTITKLRFGSSSKEPVANGEGGGENGGGSAQSGGASSSSTITSTTTTTTDKSQSKRRNNTDKSSIISTLTSHDNFYIDLDEPHRQYAPGDVIKGKVVMIIPKETKIDAIVCGLHGSISIKNPLVKGKTSRYVLFEDRMTLWGKEQLHQDQIDEEDDSIKSNSGLADEHDHTQNNNGGNSPNGSTSIFKSRRKGKRRMSKSSLQSNTSDDVQPAPPPPQQQQHVPTTLPRGQHLFCFEFELPQERVVTGVEFERGSISYYISAELSKPSRTVSTQQRSISVVVPTNVASLPSPKPTSLNVEVRRKKKPAGSITTVMELKNKGYLRGESIPVKISIKHIKQMRSISGVIVTLSRISRVTAPGLEPQTFRKDIAQTISPLFTDPDNLSADISTSVRIPPDTFPTTKGLDVISFQYYIEAVIDLAGTFNGKTRNIEHSLHNHGTSSDSKSAGGGGSAGYNSGMVDTDKLTSRRGFVNLWTDVIIGTLRDESLAAQTQASSATRSDRAGSILSQREAISINSDSLRASTNVSPDNSTPIDEDHHSLAEDAVPQYDGPSTSHANGTSEKELVRRFEETILPSQPPVPTASSSTDFEPTAPAFAFHTSAPAASSSSSAAPPPPPPPPPQLASMPSNGDKAELERQRLENLASQPEDFVPEYEPPSAPPLVDEAVVTPSAPSVPSVPSDNDQKASAPSAPPAPNSNHEASAPPAPNSNH